MMAQAHIAHDCQVGDGVIMANAATLAGHVGLKIAPTSALIQACISSAVLVMRLISAGTPWW